ncbi:MAG: acetylglucosamine-6-sulfatase [Verrucomicrobia bacterium]|nr:MAG: acetylglucosamine-6-sulfatase [Verrucomicrobiota bacterium]TAE86853.1 MAG: acetylglucosamine-6-sulfatase [Verrucomicrobiota bacterium]TAF24626.1 MAG: acetylglucosamine-6-sulfatase [Verrucomicrobiota bacterium]TAF40527.1 MAG: acetylglucosamine-6-sulfatase [Verrucomicrobiota bacterium]
MRPTFLAILLGSISLAAAEPAPAEFPAINPQSRIGEGWWKIRHENTKTLARQGGHELVFVGDSITQGWESHGKAVWDKYYASRKALNLGYSGDRTEQVLWRLNNGELENVDPKLFVLMIGTNNTGHRKDPAEQTAAGIRQIVDLLRKERPNAKILLLSIFPRAEKPDAPQRLLNDAINHIIKDFADGTQVRWLDLGPAFLAPDGSLPKAIMPDFLHPQAPGYEIWAKSMEKEIAALTGTPEIPAAATP